MKINKLISKYNYSLRGGNSVSFIVIHWVGAVSTAKDNARYFAGGDRQASAHFFVDKNSIWQSVLTSHAAWHCGGGLQGDEGHAYYGKCKNANSIGIELCCIKKDGKLIVDPKAIKQAAPLVQKLMKDYNIPSSKVIRHFDVTGKDCPGGYTSNTNWTKMKNELCGIKSSSTSSTSSKKKKYSGVLPSNTVNSNTGSKTNIKRWQKFLNWYGNYKLDVDGSFGPKTKAATIDFQSKHSLSTDGSVGPKTIEKAKTIKK